jgi:hypothetical protein
MNYERFFTIHHPRFTIHHILLRAMNNELFFYYPPSTIRYSLYFAMIHELRAFLLSTIHHPRVTIHDPPFTSHHPLTPGEKYAA